MSFNAGTQVGPYRIIEQLGQGGMAIVYKAYHASLDRYVAIKVLHRAFMEDANFQTRFQREARVVAKLEHPNIVPIYDYAEHEGQPYLAMKYIEGETLKARLQRGPLNASEVSHIIESVGAALSYAHKQGILHRDVKPSNVINANDGQIYLADFGLARIAISSELSLTSDNVLGTPQYMSPEQAMAKKDLDEGTDIYSFGVMLYEMTVGRVPFSSDTPFSVIHDHIFTPLPMPSQVNPGISPALERVLLKALAKERADRFADVASMVAAFKEAWTSNASTLALSAAPSAPETESVSRVTASAPLTAAVQREVIPPVAPAQPAAESQKTGNNRPLLLIGVLILLCICCLLGVIVLRPFGRDESLPRLPELEATTEAFFENTPITPPEATDSPADASEFQPLTLDQAKKLTLDKPRDPKAHLLYGAALLRENEEIAGYAEIKTGVSLAGKNLPMLAFAAKLFEEQEAWLAAAIVYVRVAEISKTMPQARVEALHSAVYYGAAEKMAPEVLDFAKLEKTDQALTLMAQIRYNMNYGDDEDLAEALLQQLETLYPDMLENKLLRAEFLSDQDNTEDAKKLLQDLIATPNIPLWIDEEAKNLLSEL